VRRNREFPQTKIEIESNLHFTQLTCHLGLAFLGYSSSQPKTIANVKSGDQTQFPAAIQKSVIALRIIRTALS
jgi:hypothetical protein